MGDVPLIGILIALWKGGIVMTGMKRGKYKGKFIKCQLLMYAFCFQMENVGTQIPPSLLIGYDISDQAHLSNRICAHYEGRID